MSRYAIPIVRFAILLALVGCPGESGHAGSGAAFQAPSITIVGAQDGMLVLTTGQSKTIFANLNGYGGAYTFAVGNSAVAELGVPVGFFARHRDSMSQSVTVADGAATITATGVGSTTLTVQAGSLSASVPVSVVSPSPTPEPSPTATPTPTPIPPLVASPTSLVFSGKFPPPQAVLVTEAGFVGTLSETDNCAGIVSIAPTSSTSPYTATVSEVSGGGSCTIQFTDGVQVAPVSVNT